MTADALCRALCDRLAGDGYRVCFEFGAEPLKRLRTPLVLLGIKEVSSRPAAFGGYAGSDSEGNDLSCRRLRLSFSLDIYSPPDGGEADCRRVLSALAGKLDDLPDELLSPSLEAGELRAAGESVLLPACLSAETFSLSGEEPAPYLLDFDMKGKLTI